jgi:hypothetical protein
MNQNNNSQKGTFFVALEPQLCVTGRSQQREKLAEERNLAREESSTNMTLEPPKLLLASGYLPINYSLKFVVPQWSPLL